MGRLIYGGAYTRTRFCVSNINHLLTLFLYNTRLIYKQAQVYWGAYIRGAYIRSYQTLSIHSQLLFKTYHHDMS